MKRCEREFPARPYVPPTAFLALGACCSAALVLDVGWHRRAEAAIVPLGLLGALATVFALMMLAGRFMGRRTGQASAFAVCFGVGVALGSVCAAAWLIRWHGCSRDFSNRAVSSVWLLASSDPSVGEFGSSASADVFDGATGVRIASVRMTSDEPYEPGTMVRAVGRVKPLDESDWSRSRFMKGEVAAVQIVKELERKAEGNADLIGAARARAIEVIDPLRNGARALLAGTVCGRTTELSGTEANDAFSRCGLSHLVAVSGSHLAFIALLLDGTLMRIKMPVAVRRVVLLAMMAGYVVFTGCAASALRSVLMVGSGMVATTLRRRTHPLSGLSLTVCLLVAVNPGIVYDLGFQLSALSVLFLLVFGRYMAFHLAQLGLPDVIADPLALTLVAQWATLPLTIPAFEEMSIIAPLANLVVGPLMGALLVTGLVAVPVAVLVPFGGIALLVPDALASGSIFLAQAFAGLPCASVASEGGAGLAVIAYGAAIITYVGWRGLSRFALMSLCGLAVCAVMAHVVRWAVFAPPSVTVLDVGQADSILIRDGSSAVLVDAGVDEAVLVALSRNHVFRLDAVVITHWDRDHWGGLPDVLDAVPVDKLIVPEGASVSAPEELGDARRELIELTEGDSIRVGGFSCEVVWPVGPVKGEENAESLCLNVRYGELGGESLSVLLTGDTEKDELAQYADKVGDVDVLKVGHHGSEISVAEEPLEILRPELAVASAGKDNAYGHPDQDCISLLDQVDARFLCTKDVGDVVIEPGESGPVVGATGI